MPPESGGSPWEGDVVLVKFFFFLDSGLFGRKTKVRKKGLKRIVLKILFVSPSKKLELLVIWMMILFFLYILLGENNGEENRPKNPHKFIKISIFPHLAAAHSWQIPCLLAETFWGFLPRRGLKQETIKLKKGASNEPLNSQVILDDFSSVFNQIRKKCT